jgi:hypothetical protein
MEWSENEIQTSRFVYYTRSSQGSRIEISLNECARDRKVSIPEVTVKHHVVTTFPSKTSSLYLLIATIKSFGLVFFAPAIPRIVLLLATFAQPLLLNDMLNFMSTRSASYAEGWAIFGGFVCVYGTMVMAIALYWEKVGFSVCHS